jgi:diacylglycerol O-acyltransferase
MTDRLSALDVSFLYMEEPTTPMHVGGLLVFEPPPEGFDYDRLVKLIEDRISLVPRYRQKIRWVPGHLAYPVWVDDADFEITFHVRRSALPRPGSDEQLRELVSRLMSRRLDRNRPLWEMYLVEGLEGGRIAILDVTPTPRDVPEDLWMPAPQPGAIGLVTDAVTDLVRRPTGVADTVRIGLLDVRATAGKVVGAVGGLAAAARIAARPAPSTPMNVSIGEQRRFGVARTDLDDYKRVRKAHGGTVNDVVLATVAGALRGWLLSRGEAVTASTTMRAMVPVSVRTDEQRGAGGNRVSSYLVDLPVGEPDPVVRLSQVSFAMKGHKESGQSVGADALVALGGFAPPTLHSLGARAANGFTRRLFNLVVSNVPGPQFPLYAGGAQLLELFPVVPLARGQGLSIGLTSYNGRVYYGLNADRDALPDVDVIGALLEEALAELVDTVK